MVKNLRAMQESQKMQVQSIHQEDPLEEGMATHSSILAWRIPVDRGACCAIVHMVAKSQTRLKCLNTQPRQVVRYGLNKHVYQVKIVSLF